MKRKLGLLGLVLALPLSLVACTGGSSTDSSAAAGSGSGEISYWMWDAAQMPMYQKCADDFHAANPDVTVKLSQFGWNDYWTKVTTGFISGTAPDVFVDHLSKYPEFVTTAQIAPLDDQIAKDGVKTDIYQPGLADLWVAEDGKRYGLPKDFDTIGVFYNQDMVDKAGLTKDQLDKLEWNATDGGTYEKAIAHLTVDVNGKRGDEVGFDKSNVATYGLGLDGSGAGFGQTQWAMYTASNGWTATDKLWATKYNYSDPKFQETIAWYASLITKGYMPSLANSTGTGGTTAFGAGKYALLTEGSWNTGALTTLTGIKTGIAPTPIGPIGKRASIFNGLADSIWVGSKNQAADWKWVKYLASAACQDVVGDAAVVFPAIPSGTDKAEAAFKAKGIDVTAFLVQVKDKTTVLPPVTDHASEVTSIMQAAMDAVIGGTADVSTLTAANDQVNALFK